MHTTEHKVGESSALIGRASARVPNVSGIILALNVVLFRIMNGLMKRLGLLLALTAFLSGRDPDTVKLLNDHLGTPLYELVAQFGPPVTLPMGNVTPPPGSLAWEFHVERDFKGKPATATTTSRGSIDANGNYRERSQTTFNPSVDPQIFHVIRRVIFTVDPQGRALRWEAWDAMDPRYLKCDECRDDPTQRRPTNWRMTDARQIEYGKNGKTRIFKPKGDYQPEL